MTEEKDWNKWLREQIAERERQKAKKLEVAKAAAEGTDKEPFDADKFRQIYTRQDTYGVDESTPWKTLIEESEYDYYVGNHGKTTLEEFVDYLLWLDGFA